MYYDNYLAIDVSIPIYRNQ